MPCAVRRFGFPDRGAPADREEFRRLIMEIVQRINTGQTVSVHCAGGVGRTAMVAICVLILGTLYTALPMAASISAAIQPPCTLPTSFAWSSPGVPR